MIKKRLFIGSSSEEKGLAEKAKALLDKDFDVTIWNEKVWDYSIFKINQNFLSDLLKATLQFDFGILLGTKDDKVVSRGIEYLSPRDNVLFELGLFTGRLGVSRCAFLIDEEIKLLSDFGGLSLAMFENGNDSSFKNAVNQIRDLFLSSSEDEINFFPSATLAAVYIENLIDPTCRYLIENNGFEIDGQKYEKYHVKVIIPDKISEDVNLQFEKLKSKINTQTVSFKYAGRPRTISIDTKIVDNILVFVDFPTIITGIKFCNFKFIT